MSDLERFRQEALEAHNSRRAKHGSPALKLSEDLNQYAQNWASGLAKANTFAHSKCMLNDARIGENVATKRASGGADMSGQEATQIWYGEIKAHDYSSEQNMNTVHFTQVVWKGTTEFGIGKAKSDKGDVYVVGSYRPAGNLRGAYRENVLQLKSNH